MVIAESSWQWIWFLKHLRCLNNNKMTTYDQSASQAVSSNKTAYHKPINGCTSTTNSCSSAAILTGALSIRGKYVTVFSCCLQSDGCQPTSPTPRPNAVPTNSYVYEGFIIGRVKVFNRAAVCLRWRSIRCHREFTWIQAISQHQCQQNENTAFLSHSLPLPSP